MDRPKTEIATTVDEGLRIPHERDATAYLVKYKVPDRVSCRVLSERAKQASGATAQRRTDSGDQ